MIKTAKTKTAARTAAALYTAVSVPGATAAALYLDNHAAAIVVLFIVLSAVLAAEKLGRAWREDEYAQWARRRRREDYEDAGIVPHSSAAHPNE